MKDGLHQIDVRKISSEDELRHAFAIREEVFMKEQKVGRDDEFDEFDATSTHFIAWVNGKAAATARWRRTQHGIKLERFCVLKDFRGLGLARRLVAEVMADVTATKRQGERVYLHAQAAVVGLYLNAGFSPIGEEFVECDIVHREMEYNPHLDK